MSIVDEVIGGIQTPEFAIYSLLSDLSEVESELDLVTSKLNQQRTELRNQIALVLAHSGKDKVHIPGYKFIGITSPSVMTKYNTKELDRLCAVLRQMGDGDTADDIEACKEKTERAGSLRIDKERR